MTADVKSKQCCYGDRVYTISHVIYLRILAFQIVRRVAALSFPCHGDRQPDQKLAYFTMVSLASSKVKRSNLATQLTVS